MSPSHRSKVQSVAIVISIAILALGFGVMLDDRVVPEAKKPLMTQETAEQDGNQTAEATAEMKQTAQEQAKERRDRQSAEIKQLNQKSDATIEKADALIIQTDELISKAGLPEPASNKNVSSENQKITKRLAEARSRLDALKK